MINNLLVRPFTLFPLILLSLIFCTCHKKAGLQIDQKQEVSLEYNFFLKKLSLNCIEFKSAKIFAKSKIVSENKKFSAYLYILIDKPKNFRIEATNFFNQTLFIIIVKDKTIEAFYPKEKEIFLAENNKKNLQKFFYVELDLNQWLSLLFCQKDFLLDSFGRVEIQNSEDSFIMNFISNNNFQMKSILISKENFLIKKIIFNENQNKEPFEITYNEFKKKNESFIPKKFTINDKSQKTSIDLLIEKVNFNEKMDNELFSLPKVSDFNLRILD